MARTGAGNKITTMASFLASSGGLSPSSSSKAAFRAGALSLPLLEGLSRRQGEADRIVQEVFQEWTAAGCIARFCDIYWHQHKNKKPTKRARGRDASAKNVPPPSKRRRRGGKKVKEQAPVETVVVTTFAPKIEQPEFSLLNTSDSSIPLIPCQHWLVQSLASPSVPDRQVACKILVQGCPLDDYSVKTCIDLLSNLIHRADVSRDCIATSAVGWIAILKHIVIHVLSSNERLAFCLCRQTGLTALCTSLWKFALLANKSGPQQKQTILRVCLALVDLVHALVLEGTDSSVHKIHKLLWAEAGPSGQNKTGTSNNEKGNEQLTSPLECLMATYSLWRDMRYNKSFDRRLRLLKHLFEPSLLPKIVPRDSRTGGNQHNSSKDRLGKTFTVPAKQPAAPTSTLARESSTTRNDEMSSPAPSARSQAQSSVAALLDSSPEQRSVMESVSRLIGSLYGNQEDTAEEGQNDHHHGMMDIDSIVEEEDDEVIVEDDQAPHHEEVVPAEDEADEEDDEEDEEDIESSDENDDDEENNASDNDEEVESDEMEEDEIVIHDDDLPDIEESLLEIERGMSHRDRSTTEQPSVSGGQALEQRSRTYVKAAMKVLSLQHPPVSKILPVPLFSTSAEKALVASILKIVKPPKKPFNSKVCLRRAPTQEEFFAGSLSRNPVSLSMLSRGGDNQQEPTVRDLRQHIATELQMPDSAEMLELLIANKILDVDLKLRVVCQTVWKEHCIQVANSPSSSGSTLSALLGGRGSSLSSGSGLSLMVTSSLARSLGQPSSRSFTADTPIELFPPMIMTYRLTGVDGEATEDTVSSLVDPEAPSEASSPEERERLLEEKLGITRLVTEDRGVVCLIRSLESFINDTLRKIRRDNVEGHGGNLSRQHFKEHSTPSALSLICESAQLSSNRKLLLAARAPTHLLRLLLDVLHNLDDDGDGQASESNATAKSLKELIEVLASDISSSGASSDAMEVEEDVEEDASTLRVLIQAIETSTLSSPLRNIIAKLLPYLTYGRPELSKELATEFMQHIAVSLVGSYEKEEESQGQASSVLTDTFIHASISLPSNQVCDSLRMELLHCGFVQRITDYIIQHCPTDPAPWHAFLWSKEEQITKKQQLSLEKQWREYSLRPGLKTCFDILLGLSKEHKETLTFLGNVEQGTLSFLQLCHWLESTSDNLSVGISVKKLALVAETLLDGLAESELPVAKEAKQFRRASRERKKEIALERRKKTMIKFGSSESDSTHGTPDNSSVRDTAASLLAPVLGLFNSGGGSTSEQVETSTTAASRKKKTPAKPPAKPSWMDEMDDIVDETGLCCSVCQEGLDNQPKSLLGLYCWVTKTTLSSAEARININGAVLLTNLPPKLPSSIEGFQVVEWYQNGRSVGNELREEVKSSTVANRRRDMTYTTTVSACNAIHIQCHARARQADRNHPKAPKSEWEGASLRNSRVNCNVILPLVSSRSSQVSLGSIEQALTDHQSAVANLIGVQPKSNLWACLYDVRLLLLRMAYGENLSDDCGGGSLSSNAKLIFYQLSMANSFDLEAQVDSPTSSKHARAISAGFLAAREIVSSSDYKADSSASTSLVRGIADSSTIAALTSIMFHNTRADGSAPTGPSSDTPHPKRRWIAGAEQFLRGLINCAGCRHALGVTDSGCISGRSSGAKRSRSSAFSSWNNDDANEPQSKASRVSGGKRGKNSNHAGIEDFGVALRPFLVLYAMMDQLSSDYTTELDDSAIEAAANRLVGTIESCYWSKNIHELLEKAKVTLSHTEIINELQRGMTAA